WLTWRFVRADVAPDARELAGGRAEAVPEAEQTAISRDAAILIVAFALGYTLLGYDLVMSLAHKWVSNLYGAFYFMGSFLAALMATAVFAIAMRRRMGLGALYSPRQQHDLGKLCFGFTVFWASPPRPAGGASWRSPGSPPARRCARRASRRAPSSASSTEAGARGGMGGMFLPGMVTGGTMKRLFVLLGSVGIAFGIACKTD